jgi:hypothetical protein
MSEGTDILTEDYMSYIGLLTVIRLHALPPHDGLTSAKTNAQSNHLGESHGRLLLSALKLCA